MFYVVFHFLDDIICWQLLTCIFNMIVCVHFDSIFIKKLEKLVSQTIQQFIVMLLWLMSYGMQPLLYQNSKCIVALVFQANNIIIPSCIANRLHLHNFSRNVRLIYTVRLPCLLLDGKKLAICNVFTLFRLSHLKSDLR